MASKSSQPLYSIEEYLALERASEERHEYIDGWIYAMAGDSGEHGDISVNLVREISVQLRGTSCRARSKDTKVLSGIEHYSRQPDGSWSYKIYQGLDRGFRIESIACELRLADVYDRINFESQVSDESSEEPN
jgi:Uma2 family endonuclease